MATMEEYNQRRERVAALTAASLTATDGMAQQPTPTQEENDKLALGLMGVDEKSSPPANPMPPLVAQQAYMQDGTALPSPPAPTAARTTTTSTRTTSTSGSTGASGA
jgi:hypothetical protein